MDVYVLEESEIYVEHFFAESHYVRIHISTLIVLFQTNTDSSLLHEYGFQNCLEKKSLPDSPHELGAF